MTQSTNQSYSDQPTTRDELGFAPSAEALLSIITGTELADTPLTIGIFGPWGSGKTSLMRMLLDRLDTTPCIPVWFDAWRYAQSDVLWRALLLSVVEELRQYVLSDDERIKAIITRRAAIAPETESGDSGPEALKKERERQGARLDDLVDSLYRTVDREELGGIEIQWDKAGKLVLGTAIRAGFQMIPILGTLQKAVEKAYEKAGEADYGDTIFDVFKRERSKIYRDHVQSLEQFHQGLEQLVQEWVVAHGLRLVIFIDDLDRCLPEQAVGVLEAIKVFLDIPGCIFVLGVDRAVIERGIRVRYKEFALDADAAARAGQPAAPFPIAERDYLEKIVQVPFELPPLERAAIERFLTTRLRGFPSLDEQSAARVAAVMTAGLLPNPRKVKRTLNTFRLCMALSQAHQRLVTPALLAKVVVIQSSFNDVYEHIAKRPAILKDLDDIVRGQAGNAISDDLKQLVKARPALRSMLHEDPSFAGCNEEELNNLVFQTRAIQQSSDTTP